MQKMEEINIAMNYIIRKLKKEEYPILTEFLYEAIFIPAGTEKPLKTIVDAPELRVYIDRFGEENDDTALCAEINGKIIGAVWARIMNDYGHIDNETPSLAISLYEEYRSQGIGTALLNNMLDLLKSKGRTRVSLSVQKANYALKMYEKAGFEIFKDNVEEYVMLKKL